MNRPAGCEFHNRCNYAQDLCQRNPPGVSSAGSEHAYTCHFPLGDTRA